MVHVAVRDENIANAKEFPPGDIGAIAQVEQDRPFLEDKIDVKPSISERIVDQDRIEMGRHRFGTVSARRRISWRTIA
jgi:hypothetical protein